MERIAWLTIAMFAAGLSGCPSNQPSTNTTVPSETAAEPRPSVALRILVVNEPELAEAINRLRGEWSERATGQMKAIAVPWADVATAASIEADIVVFSSRHLGELCIREWLRPVRANVLESNDFNADDLFPLVRQELMKWGGQVMAVPLGAQLVTTVDGHRWRPALRLLARAAPRAVTRERLGVLFDPETMKPRIAEPQFVEPLEELVELSKPEASTFFGESEPAPNSSVKGGEAAISVPVIGHGDLLAGVTVSSRNAASAFKLLEWLARAEISSQLGGARLGLLPVRRSLATSAKWYPAHLTAVERSKQAAALQEALNSPQCLLIPRLPGVDKYLAVLDSEVKLALEGRVLPQVALNNAAQAWERITDAKGRDKQREAYLKHLGLAE